MSNIVKLYLTRHSTSLANALKSMYPAEQQLMFKCYDSPLAPSGFELIIRERAQKQFPVDMIMTSPLKRAIQTTLMTYNDQKLTIPIYMVSLLTEFDKYPDCEGVSLKEILADVDLLSYNNFKNLNTEYFWYGNPNQSSGFWWDYDFRHQAHDRVNKFLELLSQPTFTNKTISIYTHAGVFGTMFNIGVNNYQTAYVEYNQDTRQLGNFRLIN